MTTQSDRDAALAAADAMRAFVLAMVPAQRIALFTASTTSIAPGEAVTLSWATERAIAVLLDGVPVGPNGHITRTPKATRSFTLVVKGAAPDVSQSISVAVSTGLLPTVGSAVNSAQYNAGPADWIDPSRLPAPVPWTLYSDAATQEIAPSQNGVRPVKFRRIHPWGTAANLYDCVPMVRNGRVVQAYLPTTGDDLKAAAAVYKRDPPPVGARGVGLSDPLITWHGHPGPGPLYIGIRIDNAVLALMPDGSSYIMGWIAGAGVPLDFTFTPDRMVIDVADTEGGRILRVDRKRAHAARVAPAPEDWRLWDQSVVAKGLGRITSLRCADDGTRYACDNANDELLRISPAGAVSVLLKMTKPFFVDTRKDGRLSVLTSNDSGVYVIDPRNPSLGTNFMPPERRVKLLFGTISVDRFGTLGPVDEAYVIRSHGQNNSNERFRFDAAGSYAGIPFPSDNGSAVIGDIEHCVEAAGHYNWVAECHPFQGVMLVQGFGNQLPHLLVPSKAADPPDEYDPALYDLGRAVLLVGGVEAGLQPSFIALMNKSLWGNLGCSADYIAEMTYAAAAAFVRNGMIGSFPRPAITGRYLLGILYVIYRSSQRYLREGRPLIEGLRAWFARTYPIAPAVSVPAFPDYGSTLWLQAVKDGPGIKVTLETSSSIPKAIAPATIIRVMADKGMPFERTLGELSAPWKLAKLDLSGGPHALTCEVVSGGTPSYFTKAAVHEVPGAPSLLVAPVTIAPPAITTPESTSLAQLASTLAGGEWGELVSENINESLKDPQSQNTRLRFHFCNSAPWNPVTKGIDFVGMDHGGRPALCRFRSEPNAWDNFVPCIGSHGYQHTVVNPNNGDLYQIIHGDDPATGRVSGINQWDGQKFGPVTRTPEPLSQLIANAGVWWDGEVVGGGAQGAFVFYSGNTGSIHLWNPLTRGWRSIPGALPGQRGQYQNVCAYSKAFNCLVYGGGGVFAGVNPVNRQVWRMSADLTRTRMPDAPHPVGIYSGMNMVADPDGGICFLGFGEHWKLDPGGAGTWKRLPTPPVGMLYPNDHAAVLSCATPYGVVYITGVNVGGVPTCRMWLRKSG